MQSDQEKQISKVILKAEETFGDRDKAHRWLSRPTSALGGVAPVDLFDSDTGLQQVASLLERIIHGIAA